VQGIIDAVLSILADGLLVLIFLLFLMVGRNQSPPGALAGEVDQRIRAYLLVKLVVSGVTGVAVGVTLALLGIDLALAFGVLAFALNFIPNIGSTIATILPLPIILVSDVSFATGVAAIAVPGTTQFIMGNVIEPRMMGRSLELHPITILLALIFWGMIWGIVGMLLAAPITAVLRILLDRIDLTRPVADLMAGRFPPAEPAPTA